jgi:hypothetical protein
MPFDLVRMMSIHGEKEDEISLISPPVLSHPVPAFANYPADHRQEIPEGQV